MTAAARCTAHPPARPRVLLAPITVSPTKPLTPSHLKVLLSMDLLHRATATFAEVTHLYHPLGHAGSQQVVGFWEYLDRHHPGYDFSASTEDEIGDLYGRFQAGERVGYAALEPYVRRAEAGWAHPASLRLLDLWECHYRALAMFDPGFGRSGPPPMPAEDLIALLTERGLCIDGRPFAAPVYLDATAAGLPLRTLVSADGQANYLMSTLAEIVPQLAGHDHVVLAHDTEIGSDYRTIAHVLTALGAEVSRIEFPRVPLDGVARSARFGGWHGYTVGALAEPLIAEFGAPAFALGLRLYLVAGLGRTARESFSVRHLRRWTYRAGRLLAEHAGARTGSRDICLAGLVGRWPYVDPYRLVTTLLSRDSELPAADLLAVMLDAEPTDPAPAQLRPVSAPVAGPPREPAGLSYAGQVELALLHRQHPDEAFLTSALPTGPDTFTAAALLPAEHPHYRGHTGPSRQRDPMLLLECARQAETYAAHALYGVEPDAHFVLRNWTAEFSTGPGDTAELLIGGQTSNPRLVRDRLRGLEYQLQLWSGGTRVGEVRMEVGYLSHPAYTVLRARTHQGTPPSSAGLAPAGGAPVEPARVGRLRATDVVLLDPVIGASTVTARLRVPVDNPSLFDHVQDHVPAMVLVEAARQLAALATHQWGGAAPAETVLAAVSASFLSYAELAAPIVLSARPVPAAVPPGGRAVRVIIEQAGAEIARLQLVMAVTDGPPGPTSGRGARWRRPRS